MDVSKDTHNEEAYGPWMVINKKKEFQDKRNKNPGTEVSNGFDKLAMMVDNNDNCMEKKVEEVPQKATSGSKSDVMDTVEAVKNPFQNKDAKKNGNLGSEDMIDAFNTDKSFRVPVKVVLEKSSDNLHKKLTNTLAITVSKVLNNEDCNLGVADSDIFNEAQGKSTRIRKASSQAIHTSSFLLNLKQNKAKKKKFSRDSKAIESDGDPKQGIDEAKSTMVIE
ncbi:hypothetical protein Cni_G23320 [Canna indica]|uniref:Uncharacterized protein n=1 Tax=Canna indica TaxID=4628 RepID=A0AAQ3KU62_9LILI|nr:hypothetical protein Cni_G23320 [Canna indica]